MSWNLSNSDSSLEQEPSIGKEGSASSVNEFSQSSFAKKSSPRLLELIFEDKANIPPKACGSVYEMSLYPQKSSICNPSSFFSSLMNDFAIIFLY